jgi:hypothetical protein
MISREKEMISPPPEAAWLEADEWEGDNGLLGNRRGLEVLREAIDEVLMNPEEAVVIPADEGSIRILKLCNPPPRPVPGSLRDKLSTILMFTFLFSIPLLALFGLLQLLQILFS